MKHNSLTGLALLLFSTIALAQPTDSLVKQEALTIASDSLAQKQITTPTIDSVTKKEVAAPAVDSVTKKEVATPAIDSTTKKEVATPAIDSVTKKEVATPAVDSIAKKEVATPAVDSVTKKEVAVPAVDSMTKKEVATPAVDSVTKKEVATPAVDSMTKKEVAAPAVDSVTKKEVAAPAVDSVTKKEVATPAVDSIAKKEVATPAVDSVTKKEVATSTPTPLFGEIHGFLTKDKSPYLVSQSIVVPMGRVLIIEPGVEIRFNAKATFSINQGQIIAGGTSEAPIILRGSDSSTIWEGLSFTNCKKSDLRFVEISDAKTAILLQQGNLTIQNSKIQKSYVRALFAAHSNLKVINSIFDNNAIAIHLAFQSHSYFEGNQISHNQIGLYASSHSEAQIISSSFKENRLALLYMPKSKLNLLRNTIEKNEVGMSTKEILSTEVRDQIKSNKINFNSDAQTFASKIPLPENLEVSEQEESIVKPSFATTEIKDSSSKWSMIGNVTAGINYRYVYTRRNHGELNEVLNQDTIRTNDRYPNLWEVPGIGFNTNIYLLLKNNKGQSLELSTDFYSDSWNRADFDLFYLQYTDYYHSLTLGDFHLGLGETYLAGISVLGAKYQLSLLKNKEDNPLFTLNTFFGESQRPLVTDSKNPDIYKDWIDKGEAQAQRLVWGGDFKWDPLRRFNANLGILVSDDEINDPLLRDGDLATTITTDPLQSAMSLYAEGNWLFFPGDIELNGQIAVGRADTADVTAQRAINSVFQEAGLSTASLSILRQLMQNTSIISSLSREELVKIFGDYTSLSNGEMRDSLRTLIQEAKKVRNDYEKETDDSRTLGLDFTSQNIAIGASLFWNINKTTLFGHINYVGEDYFSPGSPNLVSDVREFGGYLKQEVSPKWTFKFNYELDVENAATDSASNIFGLSEGTSLGLFEEADSLYLKDHELDIDRTKYLHDLALENTFKYNDKTNIFFNYRFEYQTQHRPYQLKALYDAESGIYKDSWFAAKENRDTTTLVYYKDTVHVDSIRWSQYEELSTEPYIASDFQEKLFKHTLDIGFSHSFWNSELKVNGIWTARFDASEFKNDSLIQNMDLSSSTWSKLGYYFYGANYFEQKFPISLKTTHPRYLNRLTFTPRYKSYERDNMEELELSMSNTLEIPLFSKFITLALSVEMKTYEYSWDEPNYMLQDTLTKEVFHYYRIENDKVIATNKPRPTDSEVSSQLQKMENHYELISETETQTERENDFIIELSAKVNHTKQLSSEWICRGEFFDRPDQLSNEYKDLYLGFNIHYSF